MVPIQNFVPDSWYHVRLEVFQDIVQILVNESVIITIQDNNPLPSGRITIDSGINEANMMIIDNLKLWMPYDEIPWHVYPVSNTNLNTPNTDSLVLFQGSDQMSVSNETDLVNEILSANSSCNGQSLITITSNIILTDELPMIQCDISIVGTNMNIGPNIESYSISAANGKRIFSVGMGARLVLTDVVVENGRPSDDGGAIYNAGGVIVLQGNTILRNNIVGISDRGGAIYSLAGSIEIHQGVSIINNIAGSNSGGGGIHANGELIILGSDSSPVIISGNHGHYGGAIHFTNTSSNSIIQYAHIANNRGFSSTLNINGSPSIISVSNSVFEHNIADDVILLSNVLGLEIINSIIADNFGASSGSAIWDYNGDNLTIDSSCIMRNQGFAYIVRNAQVSNTWWGTSTPLVLDTIYDTPLTAPLILNLFGIGCGENPDENLPPCTQLESIIDDPNFDPQELHEEYSLLLTAANSDLALRESCLRLFTDLVFVSVFHELSEDTYLGFEELDSLIGQTFDYVYGGVSDSRLITSQEVQSFNAVNLNSNMDIRYLFARAILNGMVDSAAARNSNPIAYNIRNLSESVSNNWSGSSDYCGQTELTTIAIADKSIDYCLDINWYSEVALPLLFSLDQKYEDTYNRIVPIIHQVISDEVNGVQDPTNGATGARPVNRTWPNIYGDSSCINPPLGPVHGQQAYVFTTWVSSLTTLNWISPTPTQNATCTPQEPYPFGIWENGRFRPISSAVNPNDPTTPIPGCYVASETITQAYSRHLQSTYWTDTFNKFLDDIPLDEFSRNNVSAGIRYGLSGNSVHIHALRITEDGNQEITDMRWVTFIFNSGGSAPFTTRPLYGNEFVPTLNSLPVQPLSCSQ